MGNKVVTKSVAISHKMRNTYLLFYKKVIYLMTSRFLFLSANMWFYILLHDCELERLIKSLLTGHFTQFIHFCNIFDSPPRNYTSNNTCFVCYMKIQKFLFYNFLSLGFQRRNWCCW